MGKILVPYEDLHDYMHDYHNPKPDGNCRADGQVFPCRTVRNLWEALDNPDNRVVE